LGAEASGYSGKVKVAIQPAADEGFSVVSGWSGKDPTRFPARIRAAATAIKDFGHEGEYFIHHDDGVIKIQKVSGKPNPVIFGEVPGVKSGETFPDRQAMHDANVHRGIVQGIAAEGSAIVLNEGYVDDEDNGDIIIYTGQGGQDSKNVQVADQELRAGNKFLARNYAEGIPVRVSRGPKLKSPYAPKKGYQYGGLYRIDHYWRDIGVHGFAIYRYRLIRIASQEIVPVPAAGDSPARPLPQGNQTPDRVTTTTQRVVRSTRIGKAIKELYDYTCQVCGTRLEIHSGAYAECCHIKPLGKPHNGPDVMENVLCLCPNCHVLFDHHVITVEDDLSIPQRGTKLNVAATHKLDLDHIRYHRDRVQAS
jgi:putative restriction endonuclease